MTSDPVSVEPVRVVAVADSDSYLKWGAATLDAMPADWVREQWLVTSPIMPSADQIAAATDRRVTVRSLTGMIGALLRRPPDVLLLACTGPVVQAVVALLARFGDTGARSRPVLVTGLPGISVPPTVRAVEFRRGADLFVLHSRREVAEFTTLAEDLDAPLRFALARLPFVRTLMDAGTGPDHTPAVGAAGQPPPGQPPPGRDVVFAAQAKVPPEPEQRRRILLALAALRDHVPGDLRGASGGLRGVVKVRAAAGEQQTHHELWSYPELWQHLVTEGRVPPDAVGFRAGSMADALADAAGLVTVSSTAALEAIAAGLPLLVLDEFGVSAEMINEVFVGSGCLGSLADLTAGRLRRADPSWLADNYFHPDAEADWTPALAELVVRRREGRLPPVAVGAGRAPSIRSAVRLLLPAPVVRVTRRGFRRARRIRRVYRRWRGQPDLGRPGSAAEQNALADLPHGAGSG